MIPSKFTSAKYNCKLSNDSKEIEYRCINVASASDKIPSLFTSPRQYCIDSNAHFCDLLFVLNGDQTAYVSLLEF